MPAYASSPIRAVLDRVGPPPTDSDTADGDKASCADGDGQSVPVGLLEVLAAVADPRARRGRRHEVGAVLSIAVGAVLAGARTYVAIAEWGQDLTVTARVRLGLRRHPPSESTIRRVLQRMDAEALDQVVCAWLTVGAQPATAPAILPLAVPAVSAVPAPQPRLRPVIAVDGKTARGARQPDATQTHLFAAFDHTSGVVLGQTVVDAAAGKTSELGAFAPLLDRIPIAGAVITADALHTQRGHVEYLHTRGAHYVLTVKGNQPRLHAQLAGLPWRAIPAVDVTHDKGHGRVEKRTLKLAAVTTGIGFPHARLAIQVIRRRRPIRGRWHTETVYAITDLDWRDVSAARLAEIIRGHWGIENRLHWIRDVVLAEDHSQIRTGAGPAVMATLRNLAVSLHRLHGATNIARACRRVARHPHRVLDLLT